MPDSLNPEERFLSSKYNPLRGYGRANARLIPYNILSALTVLAMHAYII